MEAVVILWGKTENSQRSVFVTVDIFRISITEKPLNAKFPAFDPDTSCFINVVKNNRSAIGWGDNNSGFIWSRARSGAGLEFTVEEFVEILELI
jgi:hypothetical protein